MAAVAVVGILAALALPRYRAFIATSRQGEAITNLGIIASLQQSYFLRYDGNYHNTLKYGDANGGDCSNIDTAKKNVLGFRATKCEKLRYTYTSDSATGGGSAASGSVSGKNIYPNCTETDTWSITDDRDLSHTANAIAKCTD